MNLLRSVFGRILARDAKLRLSLGNPLPDAADRDARFEAMAAMNPDGFRNPRNEPARDAQGLSRGDRKRAARAETVRRIKAEQSFKSGER